MPEIAVLDGRDLVAFATEALGGWQLRVVTDLDEVPTTASALILGTAPQGRRRQALAEFLDQRPGLALIIRDQEREPRDGEVGLDPRRVRYLAPSVSADLFRRVVKDSIEHAATADADPAVASQEQPQPGSRLPAWCRYPYVSAATESSLAVAVRLGRPLLLQGEFGTGRRRIADAIARARRAQLVWADADMLSADPHCAADQARIVGVADPDQMPTRARRALSDLLASTEQMVIVRMSRDPALALADGRLDEELALHLGACAIVLPPLRVRGRELDDLAAVCLADLAARLGLGSARLTSQALARLRRYPWPANLLELESVLARSLAAALGGGIDDGADLVLDASDLLFIAAEDTIGIASPDRRITRLDEAARELRGQADPGMVAPEAVDSVLAGLAHDLRNPMTTVQTLVSLAAAESDSPSAELAQHALEACRRMERHLDLLQRFGALQEGPASGIDLLERLRACLHIRTDDLDKRLHAPADDARCPVHGQPDVVDLLVELLLDEIASRLGPEGSTALVGTPEGALEVEFANAGPAGHLSQLTGRPEAASWRVALIHTLAARCGLALALAVAEGRILIRLTRQFPTKENRHA